MKTFKHICEGTRVRVKRVVNRNDPYWGDAWVGAMDKAVGKVWTVTHVYENVPKVALSSGHNFPLFVLEVVDREGDI